MYYIPYNKHSGCCLLKITSVPEEINFLKISCMMFSEDEESDDDQGASLNFDHSAVSDFGVFAEDLIEQYLRGHISFAEFCNAGNNSAPSTSTADDVPVEFASVTIDQNVLPEHSYVGPLYDHSQFAKPKRAKAAESHKNVLDEDLLSNKTSNLLAEIKEAYQKKVVESGSLHFDTDEEEEADEESDNFVDDDKDEDYVPDERLKTPKRPKTSQMKSPSTSAKPKGFGFKKKKQAKKQQFGHASKHLIDEETRRKTRSPNDNIHLRKKLPEELHSLLGQANVYFVQGRVEEAMKMCHEVVRQQPHHSEPYEVLAAFYEQLGDTVKHLQFALLAAHLDYHCPADKWVSLATLALEQGNKEQAITCYTKASKADPTTWEYYDIKIRLLEETFPPPKCAKKILETKQAAVKGMVKNMKQTFDEYLSFAVPIFEESFAVNDIQGSIVCLKSCLQRAKMENKFLYKELNHYLELLMHQKNYDDSLNAVFNFTELKAYAGKNVLETAIERRRRQITRYEVPNDFPVDIEAKTIICFIQSKNFDNSKPLLSHFETHHKAESNVDLFLDIADALSENFFYEYAESLLVSIIDCPNLPTAGVWLCYADVLSALGRLEAACKAYHNVVSLAPQHVNARLSLAALQQQLGLSEQALQTLDITDGGTLLDLDERLLYQKCGLLEQQNDMNAFYKCARQLLAMFFKEAHNSTTFSSLANKEGSKLTNSVRPILLDVLRSSQLERLVRKVPAADPNSAISNQEVWNLFFKMCEKYYDDKRYLDMLHFCCYAYMCPTLVPSGVGYIDQIIPMLLLAAFKTKSGRLMYMVLRHHKFPDDRHSYWNMMGALFMFSQDVTYQRFILRRMMTHPENIALSWFSGNNSLFSGTYQHALAEYVSIISKINENPLINLLIAITFINLSTKKDVNGRQGICIQGLCFLDKYQELRGACQETFYNIGRAVHQLGLTYAAIYYYEKVLNTNPPVKLNDESGEEFDEMFDLKRLAAHNLAFIYTTSGNKTLARFYLEKYCTI